MSFTKKKHIVKGNRKKNHYNKYSKHRKVKKHNKSIYKKDKSTKKYKKNISHTKKKFNYKKNMKGGLAVFNNQSSPHNQPLYNSTDSPTYPPSNISYVPSPLMNLQWSIGSKMQNFFNSLAGQPRQYSSSPTDQPIGKLNSPITPEPLSSKQLNDIKNSLLSTN